MSASRPFIAISESSFSGIPLCRLIFGLLQKHPSVDSVNIIHAPPKSVMCRFDDVASSEQWLLAVKPSKEAREQKVRKWIALFGRLLHVSIANRNAVIYSDSVRTVALATLLKALTFSKTRICFHQFETMDWSSCGLVNKLCRRLLIFWSKKVDVVLVPEQQRAAYFCEHFPGLTDKVRVCPNTSLSRTSTDVAQEPQQPPCTLTHVGNLGAQSYWREILELASRNPDLIFEFVGSVNSEFQEKSRDIQNIRVFGPVPHAELPQYYERADIGLVLYKPINLNTQLAAPNKVYEFWSYGIPIIAPNLQGLTSQVVREDQGVLIDFECTKAPALFDQAVTELSQLDKSKLKDFFDRNLSAEVRIPEHVDAIVGVA